MPCGTYPHVRAVVGCTPVRPLLFFRANGRPLAAPGRPRSPQWRPAAAWRRTRPKTPPTIAPRPIWFFFARKQTVSILATAPAALAPPGGQVVPMASGCWLPVTGGYRVSRLTVILRARRADNPQLPVTFGKSGNRTRRHGSRSCLCSATFIQHFWVFSSPATFAALSTRPCPRMRLLKMGLDSTSSPMDLHHSQ